MMITIFHNIYILNMYVCMVLSDNLYTKKCNGGKGIGDFCSFFVLGDCYLGNNVVQIISLAYVPSE